jgi:hypothetical protein
VSEGESKEASTEEGRSITRLVKMSQIKEMRLRGTLALPRENPGCYSKVPLECVSLR